MDANRVRQSLDLIGKVYRPILDDSYSFVIPKAKAEVEASRNEYEKAIRNQTRGYVPEPWGYSIDHEYPLRFQIRSVPNSVDMQVDIYCDIRWAESDIPVVQDIKMRIWSNHDETIFNPSRDAEAILDELSRKDRAYPGRVVSRLHFDRTTRNENMAGNPPEYHVQYGGISKPYELCWHPEKVNVPRLHHPPLELFLVCQIVAANFFPNVYRDQIRGRAEWQQELFFYQNRILRGYYEKCLNAINDKNSLFDVLCL